MVITRLNLGVAGTPWEYLPAIRPFFDLNAPTPSERESWRAPGRIMVVNVSDTLDFDWRISIPDGTFSIEDAWAGSTNPGNGALTPIAAGLRR